MNFIIYIQSFSSPLLDKFFQLVTMMGEEPFIIIVTGVVFWCLDKKYGYRLAFAYLTSVSLNVALKEIFKVPRPIGEPGVRSLRLETAGGYSFPSGHTQSAATFWTSTMLKLRKRWFTILATVMMILVGLSRIYLGVHRLIDVVFGLLIGFGWVFLANYVFNYIKEKRNFRILLIIILLCLPGIILISSNNFFKVMGTLFSLLAGYLIETGYIKYRVKALFWQQVLKVLIGLFVLVIIKTGIKILLPAGIWSDFFRYFLMGLWITAGAPYIFKTLLYK